MLDLTIFMPLATALFLLILPKSQPRLIRMTALAGSVVTLALIVLLWYRFDAGSTALQARHTLAWIPSIGASYDVALDGVSLMMMLLTGVLLMIVMIFVLPQHDRNPRFHAQLFLALATGLLGLFAARDLLLFYLFFEIGLVPMYFIIGVWGGERRSYASMKFFLYTRAGSLAMLLGFLGIYLSMAPHTFSLPAIIQSQPLANAPGAAALIFLALIFGFGVKLPIVPLHNWLPDAHVEAPTEGSVILAGLQLKMGAYGLIAIVLPILPQATARFGWVLIGLSLVSLLYGSLAALGQTDLKRLVAYTSVNHMAYVMLAVAVAALSADAGARHLAVNGAVVQMVSHGVLTGAMFLMVGLLQHRTGTRELRRFGGVAAKLPLFGALFGVVAFGSLGLPGLSGFLAEFQVIGGTLTISIWAAAIAGIALIATTGLYLQLVAKIVFGTPTKEVSELTPLRNHEVGVVCFLVALSAAIGLFPNLIMPTIAAGTARLLSAY